MKKMTKKLIAATLLISSLPLFAGNAELLRANSTIGSKYGMVWQEAQFLIKADATLDQQVQVVINDKVINAKLVGKIGDDNTLWQANCSFSNRVNGVESTEQPQDLNFYVQSIEDSKVERGEAYFLAKNAGTMLASDVQVMLERASLYDLGDKLELNGVANIKNLAYEKKVQIVYSTDQWRSVKVADARFEKYYSYGYTSVESPNDQGIENWTFRVTIPERIQSVEFAVVYSVNGQEFWDNNFGQNYLVQKNN